MVFAGDFVGTWTGFPVIRVIKNRDISNDHIVVAERCRYIFLHEKIIWE